METIKSFIVNALLYVLNLMGYTQVSDAVTGQKELLRAALTMAAWDMSGGNPITQQAIYSKYISVGMALLQRNANVEFLEKCCNAVPEIPRGAEEPRS